MSLASRNLLELIMPSWDSQKIDVEVRLFGILGMQRTGKTILANTLAYKLRQKFGDKFIAVKGDWLHDIIHLAGRDGLFRGKKAIMLVVDDATTTIFRRGAISKALQREIKTFYRIAHILKDYGIEQYTAKVAVFYIYHSYMLISKTVKQAHAIFIKSNLPKWQRWEHEDITLDFLSYSVIDTLTKRRFATKVEEVEDSMSKALVVFFDKSTKVIEYDPVFENQFVDLSGMSFIEEQEEKQEAQEEKLDKREDTEEFLAVFDEL